EGQTKEPVVLLVRENGQARPQVPYLHPGVRRGTGQMVAVRAEGHAGHEVGVSLERAFLLSDLRVPDLHLAWLVAKWISTGAGEARAVRAEGHAHNRTSVPSKGEQVTVAQAPDVLPLPAA